MMKQMHCFYPEQPKKKPFADRVYTYNVQFYILIAIDNGAPEDEWPGWWHKDTGKIKIKVRPEAYTSHCWEICHRLDKGVPLKVIEREESA